MIQNNAKIRKNVIVIGSSDCGLQLPCLCIKLMKMRRCFGYCWQAWKQGKLMLSLFHEKLPSEYSKMKNIKSVPKCWSKDEVILHRSQSCFTLHLFCVYTPDHSSIILLDSIQFQQASKSCNSTSTIPPKNVSKQATSDFK